MVHPRRDAALLVASRSVRMLAQGYVSVVLGLYLVEAGLSHSQVGTLFSLSMLGGAATTVAATALAGRWGYRRLMALSGLLMAWPACCWL